VTVKRMDHVGVVVEDLGVAKEFFLALGLEPQGEGSVSGEWVDRIVGLEGVEVDMAMLQTPDGNSRLELVEFHAPPAEAGEPAAAANTLGLRHLTFAVEDLDGVIAALEAHGGELVGGVERYGDAYRLCYLRGPAGVIIELAEELG
jgi:catechol 2,3-dioxygenase-like lactoylglutathione lyase family enzyme